MRIKQANRTERKVLETVALSAFAKHLYQGLTIKHNYGLFEAARHWHSAVNCVGEYSTISFVDAEVSLETLLDYITTLEQNIDNLESYLQEQGIPRNLSYDELDALEANGRKL